MNLEVETHVIPTEFYAFLNLCYSCWFEDLVALVAHQNLALCAGQAERNKNRTRRNRGLFVSSMQRGGGGTSNGGFSDIST